MASAFLAAKEYLTCALCNKNFDDPKTLVCLHSFCKKCIGEKIVRETSGKNRVSNIPCPTCNKVTNLSDFTQRKPEEWADLLPTNEGLINILSALNAVESSSPKQCPRHIEKEIEFYCEEHEMFSCSVCSIEYHKNCKIINSLTDAVKRRKENMSMLTEQLSSQITETETILKNRQDQMDSMEIKEREIKEEISGMKTQILNFFSQMENSVLQMFQVAKAKEASAIQLEINLSHKILSRARADVERLVHMGSIGSPLKFVEEYKKCIKSYDERQDQIEDLLQNVSDIQIEYTANKDIKTMLFKVENIGSLTFQRIQGKLAKTPRKVSSKLSTDQVPSREVNSKPSSDRVSLKEVNSKPSSGRVSHISIYSEAEDSNGSTTKPNQNVEVARVLPMKQMVDISIGTSPEPEEQDNANNDQYEEQSQEEVRSLNSTQSTVDPDSQSQRTMISLVTAQSVREFNIAVSKEYECTIEGAAIFSSGHIALTDSHNRCLKIFDENFSFIAMSKFSVTPGDVTSISDKEVVISLPETARLKHQRIDFKNRRITAGEVLSLDDKCLSVSYKNRKLACCSSSFVYVFKRQGNSWVHEGTINVYVNNLKFVALDKDAERIVVSRDGFPNRSIICMNTAGLRLWTFTHEEIRLPRGIAFHGGKVIVAASDQKTIVQLNGRTGQYEGVVYHDNALKYPWKLCVNVKGDKMLLTQKHSKMIAKEKNKVLVIGLTKMASPDSTQPS